jgi:putative intracellular protease/amidase
MAKILMLVSSAKVIRLEDGTPYPTGYFVEEAIKPYERFVAAGAEVTVATADGQPPHPDPYGLAHFFHYPDEDEDFLASVTRSFMRDAEDIRITLQHLTALDLIAARRVHLALTAAGAARAEARRWIHRAARVAWSRERNFVGVLSEDAEVTARLAPERLRAIAEEVKRESTETSRLVLERLTNNPAFYDAVRLGSLSDQQVLEFDCIFVPGGHGPMVDMANSPDVGNVLRLMHEYRRTIACLCHGPAALLSAGETARGRWLFDGYKLTAFTNEEEDQTPLGQRGIPWNVESALRNAGAVFEHAAQAWTSHVVVDRNLMTSQNPASSDAAADALLERIGAIRGDAA